MHLLFNYSILVSLLDGFSGRMQMAGMSMLDNEGRIDQDGDVQIRRPNETRTHSSSRRQMLRQTVSASLGLLLGQLKPLPASAQAKTETNRQAKKTAQLPLPT